MTRRYDRIIADNALEPFYVGIESFCRELLPADTDDNEEVHSHKIIADPVEGYSALDAWEIGIVDTLLFQRLRSIRQLGLAFLVYPTLGYSRFEHVIGVRARLEQITAVLKHNSLLRSEVGQLLPTDSQMTRMRLAVLCHDIGHCLFSHVSECVLESLPGSDQYPSGQIISNAFRRYAGRHIPMAEILSVAVLTSPSFIEHLHRIGVPEAHRREAAQKLAFDAANLIMGLPIPHDPKSFD